jgi:hypothetical protein
MKCRKKWSLEFTKASLNASFIQKEYKQHRKTILTDRVISQIQEYYPDAVLLSQRRKNELEIRKIEEEVNELRHQIRDKYNLIDRIRNGTGKNNEQNEYRKFVMPCQTTGCRGMLSSAYKCALCEKYTCSKCLESIEGNKDDHHCVQENIDTAEEIRKNTKPCPSCGSRISKIDGCFAENTPILLWNGKVKMSQDIEVGDVLIGDDGNERIVEEVCSGQDDLYEIQQNNGNSYVVNSKHTLVLQQCGKSEMVYMTVDEYMQLSQTMKNNLYGFKSRNGINYEKQDVEMDPYLLGHLICKDSQECIPDNYLCNTRETRLQLLGGMIQDNEYFSNMCTAIVNTKLSEQIVYLARSLGFMVNSIEKDADQCVINISGEKLEEIPRKKSMKHTNNIIHPADSQLTTQITVKKVGFGNYYGWNVNDNHRFILSDFTVVKNCDQMWCIECKTAFSWSKGTVEVGNIHNPHYFQWMRQNGGMPRTDALPGAGCNENQMNQNVRFITDFYKFVSRLSMQQNMCIDWCKQYQTENKLPYKYLKYCTLDKITNYDEFEFSSILKFIRFVLHIENTTFRDLNMKINTRNNHNHPIHIFILGEQTREELAEYLIERDVSNARDGAHRDILEAFIMVGKQIILDIYNELSNIELDFSWRFVHDQLMIQKHSYQDNMDRIKEFSNFYNVFCAPHKEGIDNLYFKSDLIIKKYIKMINQYTAYSNSELIKFLMLYNSKKQLEMWDSQTGNFKTYHFDNKDAMLEQLKIYSAL